MPRERPRSRNARPSPRNVPWNNGPPPPLGVASRTPARRRPRARGRERGEGERPPDVSQPPHVAPADHPRRRGARGFRGTDGRRSSPLERQPPAPSLIEPVWNEVHALRRGSWLLGRGARRPRQAAHRHDRHCGSIARSVRPAKVRSIRGSAPVGSAPARTTDGARSATPTRIVPPRARPSVPRGSRRTPYAAPATARRAGHARRKRAVTIGLDVRVPARADRGPAYTPACAAPGVRSAG